MEQVGLYPFDGNRTASTRAHIDIENLSYAYPDGRVALNDVSLRVFSGRRVGLVGHNGAGKSTLLMHLIGILRGEGRIMVDGLHLSADTVRRIRARVGLVFQDPNDQLFSPTVLDDVAFGPLYMGLPEGEVLARSEAALVQVGMLDFGPRMPHHLSLGEKKRIAIATVLSMDPVILALDEPSAGLDPPGRRELIDLLLRLPHTMLIASHDLDLIRQVCDRTVILSSGRLVADIHPDEMDRYETLLYPDHSHEVGKVRTMSVDP